ncbi:MAG: hypothetical protein R3F20_13135 [Planctomycetota bacterium]
MTASALAIALLLPLATGAALLRAAGLDPRRDLLGFLAAVYPAGALLTGSAQFLTLRLGFHPASPATPIVLAALTLGLAVIGAKRAAGEESAWTVPLRGRGALRWAGEAFFVLVLLAALGDVVLVGLQRLGEPIVSGDSAAIWTIRAKMIFAHGAIDADLPDTLNEARGAHHLDYPLLGPLLQVWCMGRAGGLLEAGLQWPTLGWYASLVLQVLAVARRRIGPAAGAALSLVYLSLPTITVVVGGTMMDHVVALAFLGLCDRILRLAEEDGDAGPNLALLGVWAAVLVWSKNEGTMLLAAAALGSLAGLRAATWRRALGGPRAAWLALPAAVLVLHRAFNRTYGFDNDLMTGGNGRDARPLPTMLRENLPTKGGDILAFFWESARDFDRGRGLFLLFAAGVLLGGRPVWTAPLRFLTLAIGIGASGYFLAYVISFEDLRWHLFTSADRTTGQLFGAIHLFLAARLRRFVVD